MIFIDPQFKHAVCLDSDLQINNIYGELSLGIRHFTALISGKFKFGVGVNSLKSDSSNSSSLCILFSLLTHIELDYIAYVAVENGANLIQHIHTNRIAFTELCHGSGRYTG